VSSESSSDDALTALAADFAEGQAPGLAARPSAGETVTAAKMKTIATGAHLVRITKVPPEKRLTRQPKLCHLFDKKAVCPYQT
jgi:hypothetical protein